jgi:acetate---CoA ligase (ADP-forming)
MFRPVAPLLQPESIAIVGASETGGSGWSRVLFHNLKEAGYPARTYLINPRRDELWGEKVYPDFGALPERVDCALVIVPAPLVNDVLRDGIDHGLKAACIYASSFGEGRKGIGAERGVALRKTISESGLAVCGPNCMGMFSLTRDILLYPRRRLPYLKAGPVGVIFHSGGTLGYWYAQAAQRGLGFSYGVSCGNEFGLDAADYLNFLAEDPDTRMVCAMLESIRRPEAFMAAARKAFDAGKPVMVMKLGRTELGKEQAKTHTGAVAVDDAVFGAMCERFGIVRCATIDEMVDFALAFGHGRLPRGRRMGIVTSSGGATGIALDAVGDAGAELATLAPETVSRIEALVTEDVDAHNPMDAGPRLATDVPGFCEVCAHFAADDAVDILAVQGRIPMPDDRGGTFGSEPYVELLANTDKPVLGFTRMAQNADETLRGFQRDSGLPMLMGIPTVVRAMDALTRYSERRARGIPMLPDPQGSEADLADGRIAATLDAYGLTPPRQAFAETPEAAGSAAAEIGFPVALKIVSADVSHKTELGGVRLALADSDRVVAEARDLQRAMSGHDLAGFLVQEMVDGLEMLVGVRDDEQFGPLVVAGLGGVFVEVMRDVSLRLAPVDVDEAGAMLRELRGASALKGFRGKPERDEEALARGIAGLSRFYLDHRPWLAEVEINPLMVLARGQGVRAVDVRTVRRQ